MSYNSDIYAVVNVHLPWDSVLERERLIVKLLKDIKNISSDYLFILGDFNTILNDVVNSFDKLDLVFFDGNHTKESTLNYFNICLQKAHNNTIFIFDDIHWSREMEKAWNEIKKNKKVRLCIDIFRMGLIFFKKELSYEKYVIKF